jgi:hypothetical protein
MNLQPRHLTGQFGTTGPTAHEKHRFHSGQAHVERVNAAVATANGLPDVATLHTERAGAHDAAAAVHLLAALKN